MIYYIFFNDVDYFIFIRYVLNNNKNNEIEPFNNENVKSYISYVTLQRQETGFGFRIVGGKEENSQVIYL